VPSYRKRIASKFIIVNTSESARGSDFFLSSFANIFHFSFFYTCISFISMFKGYLMLSAHVKQNIPLSGVIADNSARSSYTRSYKQCL
jgi:hypothetical protein